MKNIIWDLKIFLIFILFWEGSAAMSEEWVEAASSGEATFSIQPGSLTLQNNKANERIVLVTAKTTEKNTDRITVGKLYVRLQDCFNKEGKIVALDISGHYKYDNDFVFGSGNVASAMAELICIGAALQILENEKKGI